MATMRLYAKAAWMALPLLAGCAALTQLSSQGAGTNSGGKASGLSNDTGAAKTNFPEDRDWLIEGGRKDLLPYADSIRPNVGLTESDVGMSMSQYRKIEKQVKQAVLARDPKEVAEEFKRSKYGVTSIGSGTPLIPKGISWKEWNKTRTPEQAAAEHLEVGNFDKVPASINLDMADYCLDKVDKVLEANGIAQNDKAQILRASLFVKSAYYLFNDVKRESVNLSWGGSAEKTVALKSLFCLDNPRSVCTGIDGTFINIVNSKAKSLGLSIALYEGFRKGSGDTRDRPVNHTNAVVSYTGCPNIEAYDPTNFSKLDSKDRDSRALWALTYSGMLQSFGGIKEFSVNGANIPFNGYDPVSSLTRKEFDAIPVEDSATAWRISKAFR